MGIIKQLHLRPCVDPEDPDDYRPSSSWGAAVDPAPDGVSGLCALVDVVAPGDRVPLHKHPVDELIVLQAGSAEVVVGEEVETLDAGAFIFAPANTPHGARTVGREAARFLGVFDTEQVAVQYLERNPAPGTEGDAAQAQSVIDVRAAAPM